MTLAEFGLSQERCDRAAVALAVRSLQLVNACNRWDDSPEAIQLLLDGLRAEQARSVRAAGGQQ